MLADLLLHVVDAASPVRDDQIAQVNKVLLEIGAQAVPQVVVFNKIDAAGLQQRHKLTPYAGHRLRGVVRTTYLRGERVWDRDRLANSDRGQVL